MGPGQALAHTMGRIMRPAGGGPAAGCPGGAAAASTRAAALRHGLSRGMGCWAEREAGGGPGHTHLSPLLTPWLSSHGSLEEWAGGTPQPCTPCYLAFLARCGVAERRAPHGQGREEKPAQGPSITPSACLWPQAVKSSCRLCLQVFGLPGDSSLGATARKHNERLVPGRW